jgi:Flp pilus assembly pilin Flp
VLNFNWIKRHKGQGMVEYILIIAVVVGLVFAAYKIFGGKIAAKFKAQGDKLEKAE